MNEFLQRLKERKLGQWAVAYVAAAFALLQGIDIVAQRFTWPDTIERGLIIAACVGFFLVLVLAWYHGERGAQRVKGTELFILAILVSLGGFVLWRFAVGSHSSVVTSANSVAPLAIPEKSIAVLPFVNMSDDKANEYFSDGISEELLNLLAKIPQLQVTARTSSFAFKGKEIGVPEIARTLHVANVLEGSVRKAGNSVRITAQLIKAGTDTHLWSQTYDRKLDDIFAIQDEIAADVVKQLKVTLLGAVPKARTTDPEAYALYLQAVQLGRQRTAEAMKQSDALLQKVLAIDSRYAPAWHQLGRNSTNKTSVGLLPEKEGSPKPVRRS
jgi:adenylate cyclase